MYICVDFDGTIVDHVFPEIGKPVPGALIWLRKFQVYGGKIILFTMRSDGQKVGEVLTQAVDYLEKYDIMLHGINHNPDQDSWTSSPKAYGNVYIDDASACCPLIRPAGFNRDCVDWSIVGPYVQKLLNER